MMLVFTVIFILTSRYQVKNKERLQSVDCGLLGVRLLAEMWYNKR